MSDLVDTMNDVLFLCRTRRTMVKNYHQAIKAWDLDYVKHECLPDLSALNHEIERLFNTTGNAYAFDRNKYYPLPLCNCGYEDHSAYCDTYVPAIIWGMWMNDNE